MIKEALDYLAKLQTPKNPLIVEIHGEPYAVTADGRVGDHISKPNTRVGYPEVTVSTLGAFTSAAKTLGDPKLHAIFVDDPFGVRLATIAPDEFGNRSTLVRAEYSDETDFPYDTFIDPEAFLIKFRAGFYFNDEAVKVQQLCSTLESGSTVNVADDGISQAVVITSGTIHKAPVTLPAEGIPLIPWRTFRDAPPVVSKFLLRMKTRKEALPMIALFAIDQKWRVDTMQSVADYLREKLPEWPMIA